MPVVTPCMAAEWWSGIEMRHLVALDAVAREGSFRRAATRLGYVQSAISHQIAALEGLIGKRLIERSRGTRPLALTPAGEILLAHADALIARVRAAQADLAALDGIGAVALRVGATPDLLARFVPSLLRAYGAPVSLHETPTTRGILAALVRGELDLALAETPLPKGPLDAAALCADSFVVVLQAGAPLAQRPRRVSSEELSRLPLIAHAPTREHVEDQLRIHGVEPQFVLEAETGAGVQGLVAAGLGAAILPRLVADERRAETVVLELDEGLVGARAIAAVWSRTQPPRADAAAFVQAARTACALERLNDSQAAQLAG
ncbi:MAG: LysR family transcriptional regulator [Actinobacteria bacterium]|nr:LysR family transcriptional regulator [Actinomycetota bacterium]